MTPQLQQAIRLLQLSSFELELEIRNILESNPLLEREEPIEGSDEESTLPEFSISSVERIEQADQWINQYQSENDRPYLEHYREVLLQKSSEITLQQHLLWQTELAHFSQQQKAIATALIDAISEEGYLSCQLSEIQQSLETKVEITDIETVLTRIQQFDPLGVGARNLAECLSIQLEALPPSTPRIEEIKVLVAKHLESLGRRDYNFLKLALKLDEKALHTALKILTSLNPKPGLQISSKKCDYLIPDVIALKKQGRLIVELNKEFIPKLRINSNYATLINDPTSKGYSQAFKTQLKEAKWFLKGIKARNETLLKVARTIMEQQNDFLDHGNEAMKPLGLQDIARAVNLHESTISRITNKKYILTPRGVFELKHFFSNSIVSAHGEQASTTAIRSIIKKIIEEEASQEPFSDDKITKLLAERGINIARRTVTKYRESMRIPSSTERKRLSFS